MPLNKTQLRDNTAKFAVVSHFGLLVWVFGLFLFGGFTFSELKEIARFLIPMFGTGAINLLTVAIKDTQVNTDIPNHLLLWIVNKVFYAYIFSVATIVTCKAFNIGLNTMDQLNDMVVIVETIFASFYSLCITNLLE